MYRRTSVNALCTLDKLEYLNLTSNLISNIDGLIGLRSIKSLIRVDLNDNPICQSELQYPNGVFITISSLLYLDGYNRYDTSDDTSKVIQDNTQDEIKHQYQDEHNIINDIYNIDQHISDKVHTILYYTHIYY
jgi:Leucine-rich repeat (LRR) protein